VTDRDVLCLLAAPRVQLFTYDNAQDLGFERAVSE